MATTANVRVGDIGTQYRAKIQDNGAPFNFTDASIKRLIWTMPQNRTPIVRDAQMEHIGSDYFLVYTVVAADASVFHTRTGTVKWQGYVEFAGGEKYHTNIEEFRIEKNLN